MRRELLLGSCANLTKQLFVRPFEEWNILTTLDHPEWAQTGEMAPDVLWDLEKLPLPFEDNSFDEIHAYQVCEHVTGQQGDAVAYFAFFTEMARIMRPEGFFMGSVPRGHWVWADPSHKREIARGTLTFLSQREYQAQVGHTSMSDYRNIYKADFEVRWTEELPEQLRFVLQVIK